MGVCYWINYYLLLCFSQVDRSGVVFMVIDFALAYLIKNAVLPSSKTSESYTVRRPDDLRGPFEQFGPLKGIYLPRDYYTG